MTVGYIFWLVLTIIFTIIEFAIPVWFAFAAALTVFVSLISDSMKVEITFFTVVSLLSLIFLRPYARAILSKNKDNFDAEKIDTAIIVKKIVDTSKEEKIYDVSYKGSIWTALSNELFEVGDTPVISSFKGNKIILKK